MRLSSIFLVAQAAVVAVSAFQQPNKKAFVGSSKAKQPAAVAVPFPETSTSTNEEQLLSKSQRTLLGNEEDWVKNLDYDGFAAEVTALGKEIASGIGQEDVDHLQKIVSWRNAAAAIGIATMWMSPNPLTVVALSTWTYASWTMIAHHTCHGGYNRVDAGGFNSRGFALGNGVRRLVDWCDWMMPEAWNVEHNRLHHYHLGEERDPDLVQRNLDFLREMEDLPMIAKYGVASLLMPVWKWFYYSPNTYKELQYQTKYRQPKLEAPVNLDPDQAVTFRSMLFPQEPSHEAANKHLVPMGQFLKEALLPFFASRFVALPAPLLLVPSVGPTLFGHAIMNLILADLLTNIHGFITIVTNHAGEDVYEFDDEVRPKTGSFYVRQIVGSVNYDLGTDPIDFAHGWLNYQIEHHVWPDFSMRQYQKAAPKLKAICATYGVPYIQENVFERLRKTMDIMVGRTSMKVFPTHLEPLKDKAGKAGVTWKSTNGAIDE
mmetsp:Transcript_42235/g.62554  ORF Transcript_42235/g.62554 Transcript_42235/m.62554 type:complete len:488 (-) Transcript_42235:155-1618(-)|eukprot:CAMPEP_0194039134 /NCGR_PEP_ID=MMETSP0009_2-20130614/11300_1 /TAXON_ID=210454 /ORGANISM="Grammatophora oceanica, Strain CCMP 410" /LENGTH=487 /DNA_ID=CAMNT_0038681873 /DNA_START=83 /DNA_END=1546 /DNA_ORIENTATION=-